MKNAEELVKEIYRIAKRKPGFFADEAESHENDKKEIAALIENSAPGIAAEAEKEKS